MTRWYKKASVQSAFVGGIFVIAAALITIRNDRVQNETVLNVPPSSETPPFEASPFEVYSYHRELNLTEWKLVSAVEATQKISKAVWRERIRVRRNNNSVKTFVIRHATSGLPDPEFLSDSHRVQARETSEKPLGGPDLKLRVFDVSLDVSPEPIGDWFDLRLQSTYWNAFNNPDSGWAAWPIVQPAKLGTFTVIFPKNKIPPQWERRIGPRDTKTSEIVTDDMLHVDGNGSELSWTISEPRLNWVYKYAWKW